MKKPLKVGFDLDGVLLYNPTRNARPVIKFLKEKVLRKKKVSFYVPRSGISKFLWDAIHKSSLWIAPGIHDIYQLIDDKKIEAHIITARFEHLKKDTTKWFNKLNHKKHFTNTIYNKNAKQPHQYKAELIEKMNLDIFIDDNWDIVKALAEKYPQKKIFWVSNLLDSRIDYKYKFPNLKKAIKHLKEHV